MLFNNLVSNLKDDELLTVDKYPQLKNNGQMSVEAALIFF